MAGTPLPWSSNYPTTIDDTTTEFPTLVDGVHVQSASAPNSLAAAVVALEEEVGATSPAAGSLRERVATLEDGLSGIDDYLTMVNIPSGAPDPDVLYRFDGGGSSLTDRSGNGHDLTTTVGAFPNEYAASNGRTGARWRLWCARTNFDGALTEHGAFTAELQLTLFATSPAANSLMFWCGGLSAASADNVSYSAYFRSSTESNITSAMVFEQKYGSGSASNVTVAGGTCMCWQDLYVVITREPDGVTYKTYINGRHVLTGAAPTVSDGGGSAALWVGGYTGVLCNSVMPTFRLSLGTTHTAAQILEVAKRLRYT